jgi:hypothetical protein
MAEFYDTFDEARLLDERLSKNRKMPPLLEPEP